jgi:hypothetical protein
MALYLITYDLRKARNYPDLYDLLKYWRAQRLLASVWLAELAGPAHEIRDIIRGTCDADDGIAVIELRTPFEWATIRAEMAGTDFLNKRVPFARHAHSLSSFDLT